MFSKEFWSQVEEEVKNGYINVQKHPTEFLWIYNYSQNAMFDGRWNEATMNCRGLVVDENKKVIARPFKKFMTVEQCQSFEIKIPYEEEFEVMDKCDGSLGILYWLNPQDVDFPSFKDNLACIATRGSFTSDQAIEATKIIREKYYDVFFDARYTYLFEIIYPENRIVVDYGSKRDLILLAIVMTETGEEISLDHAPRGLNVVTRYHGIKDFSKVLNNFEKFKGTEFEGLVIKFKSGFRVKIKTEDYKRLHKILSGINSRRIWECLSSGQGLQEILDVVDDAFYKWVKQVSEGFNLVFELREKYYKERFQDALKYADNATGCIDYNNEIQKLHRKNFAKYVSVWDDPAMKSVAFQMYSNGDYKSIIWDSIKPKGDQKYKVIEEE